MSSFMKLIDLYILLYLNFPINHRDRSVHFSISIIKGVFINNGVVNLFKVYASLAKGSKFKGNPTKFGLFLQHCNFNYLLDNCIMKYAY